MFPAFLTTILFSISAVCAHRTTRMLGGIEANFWRLLLATFLLGLWAHSMGQGLRGEAFPIFFLSGCVGFGIGDIALYQALPRLGSRLSILLVHCLAAPFAAATEWIWLGNILTAAQMLCGITILAGVSLALAPGKHLNLSSSTLASGVLFGVLAAFGQGFGAVLSRKAYEVADIAGQPIDGMSAAYQRIIAGLIVAFIFLYIGRRKKQLGGSRLDIPEVQKWPDAKTKWRAAWPWIFVNGLAGPALGVSCYQWALATTPTGIVLPIVAITPLVVIPFARVLEGERPSAQSLLGGGIAVAGVVGLTLVS
jgi:drug/metabolite transporter (DMT)-like permease